MIQYLEIIPPIIIPRFQSGSRLDQALSKLLLDHSRSQIKSWILQKKVKLNKLIVTKPKKKVFPGDLIEINDIFKHVKFLEAENIFLDIVYEDDFLLVVNKPSNFVVHPGVNNISGTLLNALLYHYPSISSVPRAGIVQRLDKDTTGLILIAKDIFTRNKLLRLFRLHQIIRGYEAIVVGNVVHNGIVNQPIARHTVHRTCMSVCSSGKSAVTYYQVLENFLHYSRIKLKLETGRTHQIRVHMAYIKHPIFGDQKYGKSRHLIPLRKKCRILNEDLFCFHRQALHASTLKFFHPITNIMINCHTPLPRDMLNLLRILRLKFCIKKNN